MAARQVTPLSDRPGDTCQDPHPDVADLTSLRTTLLAGDALNTLADTFKALGDVTRVRILDALSHGALCVCDLAHALGLTESAVSHQLRLLRGIRLVRARRAGRQVFYAIDDHHIMSLFKQARHHVQESSAGDRPRGEPELLATGSSERR